MRKEEEEQNCDLHHDVLRYLLVNISSIQSKFNENNCNSCAQAYAARAQTHTLAYHAQRCIRTKAWTCEQQCLLMPFAVAEGEKKTIALAFVLWNGIRSIIISERRYMLIVAHVLHWHLLPFLLLSTEWTVDGNNIGILEWLELKRLPCELIAFPGQKLCCIAISAQIVSFSTSLC